MRQRSKEELICQAMRLRRRKETCYTAPFTSMAVVCNYVLWKTESFTQGKLTKYNQIVDDYYRKVNALEITIQDLADRVYQKAGITIEYSEYTEADILVSKKKKYSYSWNRENIEVNNIVNRECIQYLLICFNALMDLGYGKMRLDRVRGNVVGLLNELDGYDGNRIMRLHGELVDGVGIYIEKPIVR